MNIVSFPGSFNLPASEEKLAPNENLVKVLKDLLERAEAGTLQTFIGVGRFPTENAVAQIQCELPRGHKYLDVYGSLGALEWAKVFYIEAMKDGFE